jgi:hypothetical protein
MIVFRQPSNRPTVSISQLKLLPTDSQLADRANRYTKEVKKLEGAATTALVDFPDPPPLYYTNAGEIRVMVLVHISTARRRQEHLVRDVAVQSSLGNRSLPSKRGQC